MGEFTRDEVLYFMLSKNGRVRNHELVTHFKNFLDHPNNKAKNRALFKDFVNELASVKLDGGEKVLVLKKKFRAPNDNFGRPPGDLSGSSASISSSSLHSLSAVSSNSSLSTLGGSDIDFTPKKSIKDDFPRGSQINSENIPGQNDSPRAKSEPPPSKMSESQERKVSNHDVHNGGSMSKIHSDERMDVLTKKTASSHVHNSPVGGGSDLSLASNDSQRSATSSTSGVISTEEDANASVMSVKERAKKLNRMESEGSLPQPRQLGGSKKSLKSSGDDDDASHSSGLSYITLDDEQREWMITCSGTEYHEMNRLLSKNPNLAKLKDLTNGYTALHWAAKSGKAEVIKLVADKPGVNVDNRSNGGYTALHLAAIHGHEHIIELLVSVFKADANLRDYSGRKPKQYLKNSASSKAQQLLMSRKLVTEQGKSNDDAFTRMAASRMSNRAKTMTSLMQNTSSVVRQPMLRSSWAGSHEYIYEETDGTRSGTPSPSSMRKKYSMSKDKDLMPPPSNIKMSRSQRHHYRDRSKSSSRESLTSMRQSVQEQDENQNIVRSESDPSLIEGTLI